MKYILFLATTTICLTALIGISAGTAGVNYISGCFGSKSYVPALLFACFGGAGLAYTIWSNRKNMSVNGKPTRLAIATLLFAPVIGLFMQITIPILSLFKFDGHWANITFYMLILVFFLTIGNYVTTTRRDGFGGIRNSWTLSSRTIWANTQRLHGHLLVFGGLATLILVSVSSVSIGLVAILIVYLSSISIATAYSAYLAFSMEPAL